MAFPRAITARDFNISYEIIMVNPLEYKVFKYKHGFTDAEYTVANQNNSKWKCSCISGHTRGYCKHRDWINLIIVGNADMLPGHVKLHESIDVSVAKRQVLKALTRLANKKVRVHRETSIEK